MNFIKNLNSISTQIDSMSEKLGNILKVENQELLYSSCPKTDSKIASIWKDEDLKIKSFKFTPKGKILIRTTSKSNESQSSSESDSESSESSENTTDCEKDAFTWSENEEENEDEELDEDENEDEDEDEEQEENEEEDEDDENEDDENEDDENEEEQEEEEEEKKIKKSIANTTVIAHGFFLSQYKMENLFKYLHQTYSTSESSPDEEDEEYWEKELITNVDYLQTIISFISSNILYLNTVDNKHFIGVILTSTETIKSGDSEVISEKRIKIAKNVVNKWVEGYLKDFFINRCPQSELTVLRIF